MAFPDVGWLLLAGVVALGFATEAALGFGAMVLSLALGAHLLPIERLLPTLVPLNLGLSLYLAGRYARDIDRGLLFRSLLPAVLCGVPLGLLAFTRLPGPLLVRAFGIFVVVLAAAEILRGLRGAAPPRLGRVARLALLGLGGAIHGAFATGGPLIVYVVGREIEEKGRFRATLSALWALLGLVLCASYATSGSLTEVTLTGSARLALPALVGLAFGEWVHTRAPASTFRVGVFVMLLVAGVLLLVG